MSLRGDRGDPGVDPDAGPFSEIPGGGSDENSSTGTISGLPTGSGDGGGSLTISSTTGPLAPSSTSGSSSTWTFEPISDMQTCQPITIAWDLPVDAVSFDTTLQFMLLSDNNASMSIELTEAHPIEDEPFIANNVSVPAGTYYIQGKDSGTGFLTYTNHFHVTTGPNTTCLDSSQNASTIATSSHPSSSASSPSPSSSSKTAVIVGSTVGGIAALGLMTLGALWFILFRRNRTSGSRQKNRRARGGWGGLDSVEYKPTSATLAGSGAAARRSTSVAGSVVKDADKLDVVAMEHPESSLSSLGYDHPSRSRGYPPVRSPSATSSVNSHELVRLPMSTPPVTPQLPAKAASRSLESPFGTPSTSPISDPFTPAATNGDNKRSSRTQRKPVPAYEPTPEELAQLAMARSQSESGLYRSGSSSKSSSRAPSLAPISSSLGSTSPLSSSPHAQAMLENLKNKSSGHFAGDNDGNVHFLIPDPPMPSRK